MIELVDQYHDQFWDTLGLLGQNNPAVAEAIATLADRGINVPGHQAELPYGNPIPLENGRGEVGAEDMTNHSVIEEEEEEEEEDQLVPNSPNSPLPQENGWTKHEEVYMSNEEEEGTREKGRRRKDVK